MVVPVICRVGCRKVPSLCYRFCSSYIRRMRYLSELKEDDDACRQAYNSGSFFPFHNLSPFLQQKGKMFLAPKISAPEMKRILVKLSQNERRIEDSMLVGCSEKCTPYFALDLVFKNSVSLKRPSLWENHITLGMILPPRVTTVVSTYLVIAMKSQLTPGSLERTAIEYELGGSFADLWKAFFQLEVEDASLVFSAQALLRWHNNNKYCGKSGQPTEKNLSGSKRVCQSSETIYYPQVSPVVITLVSDGSRCLLARQASFPKGMYTALSGFCDVGESLEETVRREVAEEVGLEIESLWYSASQHWPFPNSSLMLGCHATVCPQKSEISINRQELEAAKWFSLEEVEQALGRTPKPSQEEDNNSRFFWVPPKQAIAHRLIQEWVKKQAVLPAEKQ